MSDLSVALTSEYIQKEQLFRASQTSNLLVLVEDDLDAPFWRELFTCISSAYNAIHVYCLESAAKQMLNEEKDENGDTLTAHGKDALMKVAGLGKNKVVAVDRDWDGLIPSYHGYSDRLKMDKYVISTTYYAIENHILHPAALSGYLERLTGMKDVVNTNDFIAQFNDCLSPILYYLLACEESAIQNQTEHAYSINQLRAELGFLQYQTAFQHGCQQWKTHIKREYQSELMSMSEGMNAWQTNLQSLGKAPNDLWKVVQGHTLCDCVWKMMKYYVSHIYDTKRTEIIQNVDPTKRQTKLDELRIQICGSKDKTTDDAVECVMYQFPIIDYEDDGIQRIITKIQNILTS